MALEQKRFEITRKQQRVVTLIMVLYHVFFGAFYICFIVYQHDLRNRTPDYCSAKAFVGKANIKQLLGFYNVSRLIVTVIINTWLLVVTGILSRTIRKSTDDWTLIKNNRRLLMIIWGFIILYSTFVIQETCFVIWGYQSFF